MEGVDHHLDALKKDIRLAREFDREIIDLQRRACEPSRLGGGNKTRSVLDSLKREANEILTEVRGLADEGKERNRTSRELMEQSEAQMKQMKEILLQSEAQSAKPGYKPANVPRVFKELYEKTGENDQPPTS